MTSLLAVDIGGTFTDIVLRDADGRLAVKKVSSSVGDFARAVVDGSAALLREAGQDAAALGELRHCTTVASNAILERSGGRTGLITTKGFRDILEIRSLRVPRLYDPGWSKPRPLVERHLRMEVAERMTATGEVEEALDEDDVARAIDALLVEGVEAIAVCLLHAYANPLHEQKIERLIRARAGDIHCCISSEVLPEIKEYERTSTTVINAYVTSVVTAYLLALRTGLRQRGIGAPIYLLQSSGGLIGEATITRKPMTIIESGPAGGVVGAEALARQLGIDDVISFDMGGTTAKASLIEGGAVSRAPEIQIGGGIMMGARLMTGAGYLLKVPAIDLAEVGAGGGSIVSLDSAGAMRVGPRSAGALPGPLCYGLGGTRPTITDANLILGYINPEFLAGGAVPLQAELSHRGFRNDIAGPMGMDLAQAAHGAFRIVGSNMNRAIRAVSSERGRDPRRLGMVAFGGNGPIFAAAMAEDLGIRHVVVPPFAGLFSAVGLLHAQVEHQFPRSFRRPVSGISMTELQAAWAEMAEAARAQLLADGVAAGHIALIQMVRLRYVGQTFELPVPMPDEAADIGAVLAEQFGREHQRSYGHRAASDEPVEIVGLLLIARGPATAPPRHAPVAPTEAPPRCRQVYFGARHGWLETPIIGRSALALMMAGPCIVEEYDATCVVPPGAQARLDEFGNIRLDIGDAWGGG